MFNKFKKAGVLNGDGRWLIQAPEGYQGKKQMIKYIEKKNAPVTQWLA